MSVRIVSLFCMCAVQESHMGKSFESFVLPDFARKNSEHEQAHNKPR